MVSESVLARGDAPNAVKGIVKRLSGGKSAVQPDVFGVPFGEAPIAEHACGFVCADLGEQTEEVFARADGECGADGAVIATDELSYAASSEIRIAIVALFLQEFEYPDVNVGRTVGTEVVEIGLRGSLSIGVAGFVGHGREVARWLNGRKRKRGERKSRRQRGRNLRSDK